VYKTRVRICPLATAVKVKAVGPSITKIGPLKSVTGVTIRDQCKQLEGWAEHYQELYSRETIVIEMAVQNTIPLADLQELDIPPSAEDLSKAIDTLACGKVPGNDGIPPEVIKFSKASTLPSHLHELLLKCWDEGMVPQDVRNSNIITLYKK